MTASAKTLTMASTKTRFATSQADKPMSGKPISGKARASTSTHITSKSGISASDARHWRRFLTNAPPLEDLIEIRRMHDNKTIIRRRAELPPSFSPSRAEWRPL